MTLYGTDVQHVPDKRPSINEDDFGGGLLTMIAAKRELRFPGLIGQLPHLTPPSPVTLADAAQTLIDRGAVDTFGHLTEVGTILAKLP